MASIIKRGPNTYRITVSNGRLTTGKQDRRTTTVTIDENLTERQRQKEIERLAYEFKKKVKNGEHLDGAQTTLLEFAEKWLKINEDALAPKTWLSYHDLLEGRLSPLLGIRRWIRLNQRRSLICMQS